MCLTQKMDHDNKFCIADFYTQKQSLFKFKLDQKWLPCYVNPHYAGNRLKYLFRVLTWPKLCLHHLQTAHNTHFSSHLTFLKNSNRPVSGCLNDCCSLMKLLHWCQRPYERRLNRALCVLQTYFRLSLGRIKSHYFTGFPIKLVFRS